MLILPGGALAASPAPLDDIARAAHMSWFSGAVDLCVALSFYSCLLAVTNTGARVLYTLSRDRVLPRALSHATARHGEPWFAVLLITASALATVMVFAAMPTPPMTAYGYLGTLDGYFFIGVYLMVIALTLLHAVRSRALSALLAAAGLVGTTTLALALYFSFIPLPSGPYRAIFWIFVVTTAVVLIGAAFGGAVRPRWWRALGDQADEPAAWQPRAER